jgi:hypothetical protein
VIPVIQESLATQVNLVILAIPGFSWITQAFLAILVKMVYRFSGDSGYSGYLENLDTQEKAVSVATLEDSGFYGYLRQTLESVAIVAFQAIVVWRFGYSGFSGYSGIRAIQAILVSQDILALAEPRAIQDFLAIVVILAFQATLESQVIAAQVTLEFRVTEVTLE